MLPVRLWTPTTALSHPILVLTRHWRRSTPARRVSDISISKSNGVRIFDLFSSLSLSFLMVHRSLCLELPSTAHSALFIGQNANASLARETITFWGHSAPLSRTEARQSLVLSHERRPQCERRSERPTVGDNPSIEVRIRSVRACKTAPT